jgi:predicted nicotinamide N-methyase
MTSFAKKKISLAIGSLQVKLTMVEDPEVLFRELLEKDPAHIDAVDERIPYWCDLWPSAIGLATFISEHPGWIKGKSVVEIGCGLALPGIVAGMLGGHVVLTDYLEPALRFAAGNWKQNIHTAPQTKLLDWRSPGDFPPADVLLASDVAYETRSFEPLLLAMKSLVKKDGLILLSEPNRKFAGNFLKSLHREYRVSEETRKITDRGISSNISVYAIRGK